jgi:hypothetical protein
MLRSGLILFLLASCGPPEPPPAPILPSNVEAACTRAVECEVFAPEQAPHCIECLENLDLTVLQDLEEQYGKLPPLETIACDLIQFAVRKATNIGECVDNRWYGE